MIDTAILGFGTVGSGVAELLDTNRTEVAGAAGQEVRVKRILDLRDFPGSPYAGRVVRDMNVILEDPEIKIICETMGGTDPAFQYTKAALERGISVCTSNKELVDAHGGELSRIAKEHQCSYLFEASVGGGIPLLRTLRDSCRQEKITSVTGILNGTCNYILTKMAGENMTFSDALRQAQANGFAEQNPDADIQGHDTARKLAILASLVSGRRVRHEQVPCEGIMEIDSLDFAYAAGLGMAIKLLGICRQDFKNPEPEIFALTAPCLVPAGHPLHGVNGVFNGALVHGNMAGDLMFYGQGAGKLPTASAVVADIIECAGSMGRTVETGLNENAARILSEDEAPYRMRNFIRVEGGAGEVREALGKNKNIIEVSPGAHGEKTTDEAAFITPPMTEREFKNILLKKFKIKKRIRILEE